MALSKSALKDRIVAEMEAAGATASGDHSWVNKLADAIAKAVVDEIQASAKAVDPGGTGSGEWPIQ